MGNPWPKLRHSKVVLSTAFLGLEGGIRQLRKYYKLRATREYSGAETQCQVLPYPGKEVLDVRNTIQDGAICPYSDRP